MIAAGFPSHALSPYGLDAQAVFTGTHQSAIRLDSQTAIRDALNERVEIAPAIRTQGLPYRESLGISMPVGRIVAQTLLDYLGQGDPQNYGGVCKRCGKLFLFLKGQPRFCSDQCRWDYWNDDKMQKYYAAKKRGSRANQERNARLKSKGRKKRASL
jgi:hypothetical protein